jgi:ABC-type transporter Mla subunit MlaD
MNTAVVICIAIVTGALVVLAFAAARALGRFAQAGEQAAETAKTLDVLLKDATHTSREIRELVESLEGVSASLTATAERLGVVADRAADVSTGVLDEIEAPIKRAIRVVRGVRNATSSIMDRWSRLRAGSHDGVRPAPARFDSQL